MHGQDEFERQLLKTRELYEEIRDVTVRPSVLARINGTVPLIVVCAMGAVVRLCEREVMCGVVAVCVLAALGLTAAVLKDIYGSTRISPEEKPPNPRTGRASARAFGRAPRANGRRIRDRGHPTRRRVLRRCSYGRRK